MERIEIRLAGSGGQGLITGSRILFRALAHEGKYAAQSQSYEPTSRGGFCRADLVVSEGTPDYPLVACADYLIALDQVGADRAAGQIADGALVLYDDRLVEKPPQGPYRRIGLPLTDRAIALGNHRIANIVAVGALVGLTRLCDPQSLDEVIRLNTPKKFTDLNREAAREGARLAAGLEVGAA